MKTKDLVFIALYAALAVVLKFVGNMIPFLAMPNGGSIELEMIPIFIASYHLGWKKGALTGVLSWLIHFILGQASWFVNPMQYALDYLIPVVACGMASLIPTLNKKWGAAFGITTMMGVKYMATVLSGVYYWVPEEMVAGSAAAWFFSLNYNAWYNLATCVLCAMLVPPVYTKLKPLLAKK